MEPVMTKRAFLLGAAGAILMVGAVSQATAAERRYVPDTYEWVVTRKAIERQHEVIALMEANPDTDDGYKAPIITRAHREMWRLHAKLERPQWRYVTPCCYSRPPVHIR
jgi:hypothetical protein